MHGCGLCDFKVYLKKKPKSTHHLAVEECTKKIHLFMSILRLHGALHIHLCWGPGFVAAPGQEPHSLGYNVHSSHGQHDGLL